MFEPLLLLGAGFLAAAMNAVAGGGTFVTLPALVGVGLTSLVANVSSTVALCPGTLASAWAYRREMRGVGPLSIRALLVASAAGGLVGAVLLLVTPTRMFDQLLPWLLLVATLLLAAGTRVRDLLARRRLHVGPRAGIVIQFLVSIYGGYFGGALGLIMMAAWTLVSDDDLKTVAPARVLCGSVANLMAIGCFVLSGAVAWGETGWVLIGAVLGGYLGARLARRLPAMVIRALILAVTVVTTAMFFWRAYG